MLPYTVGSHTAVLHCCPTRLLQVLRQIKVANAEMGGKLVAFYSIKVTACNGSGT